MKPVSLVCSPFKGIATMYLKVSRSTKWSLRTLLCCWGTRDLHEYNVNCGMVANRRGVKEVPIFVERALALFPKFYTPSKLTGKSAKI